jgi:hypothetical protein
MGVRLIVHYLRPAWETTYAQLRGSGEENYDVVGLHSSTGGVKASGEATTKVEQVQNLRPSSDISNSNWIPRTGSSLYPMLVDSANDSSTLVDLIYGLSGTGLADITLSSITDPGVSWGHTISYIGQGRYTVSLRETGNPNALISWVEDDGDEEVSHTYYLSASVVDSINNYANLYVRLEF